jgi:CheY-specific phosphatase CheX
MNNLQEMIFETVKIKPNSLAGNTKTKEREKGADLDDN